MAIIIKLHIKSNILLLGKGVMTPRSMQVRKCPCIAAWLYSSLGIPHNTQMLLLQWRRTHSQWPHSVAHWCQQHTWLLSVLLTAVMQSAFCSACWHFCWASHKRWHLHPSVTQCSSPSCSTCTNGPLATANCRTAPRTGFCKPVILGNCFFSNCSAAHTWSSVSILNSSKTKSTRCCFDEPTTLAFLCVAALLALAAVRQSSLGRQ